MWKSNLKLNTLLKAISDQMPKEWLFYVQKWFFEQPTPKPEYLCKIELYYYTKSGYLGSLSLSQDPLVKVFKTPGPRGSLGHSHISFSNVGSFQALETSFHIYVLLC